LDSLTAYKASKEVAFRLFRERDGLVLDSDFALNKPPRGPQINAPIQMGLSMWTSDEGARRKNDEFDGRLGDRIAVLELEGSLGIWWAQTFSAEHMTVWGRPDDLEECVRDIYPV
jgi:hypothetical protein